jgi:hypothetical protein
MGVIDGTSDKVEVVTNNISQQWTTASATGLIITRLFPLSSGEKILFGFGETKALKAHGR